MKKLFFFILTCTFFSTSFGKQYFIANNGNDTNLGTIESPFLGFDAAYSAAQPGDTIWVRGGVYNVSTIWKIEKAGNVNAYYNLWGYTPDIQQGDFAPAGWRVPAESDFDELMNYLGGALIAGAKMKEAGLVHWASPNLSADNSSNFTALPCGLFDTIFKLLKEKAAFWLKNS